MLIRPRPSSPSSGPGGRLRATAAHALPALLLWGCGGGGSPALEPFTRVDSAGVEVVRNRPGAGAVHTFRLPGEPLLLLGSERAGSPELFARFAGVHFGPDGAVWVVEGASLELRVFELSSGAHRFTAGGRGQGPGEFEAIQLLGFDDVGDAWIWDDRQARLTILAQLPTLYRGGVSDGTILEDTVRFWGLDSLDGEPLLWAERPGVTWYVAQGMQAPIPFAAGSRHGVRGNRLVLTASGGDPVLDVVEDGRLVRRIHLERPRLPVTSDPLDENLAGSTRTPQAAALLRESRGEWPHPTHLPTWEMVRVGPGGRILALQAGTLLAEERWDLFNARGRHTGVLTLGPHVHLSAVGDGVVAVLEVPALRGPSVGIYRWDPAWDGGDEGPGG